MGYSFHYLGAFFLRRLCLFVRFQCSGVLCDVWFPLQEGSQLEDLHTEMFLATLCPYIYNECGNAF